MPLPGCAERSSPRGRTRALVAAFTKGVRGIFLVASRGERLRLAWRAELLGLSPTRMVIKHADFIPQRLTTGDILEKPSFATLDTALAAANAWLTGRNVDVINVETVVLPNLWDDTTRGTLHGGIEIVGESSCHWHQLIRIWYREHPEGQYR
jgi:hypothetical protein